MIMKIRIHLLYRSMSGQLFVLWLAFMLIMVGNLVIEPIVLFHNSEPSEAISETLLEVGDELVDFARNEKFAPPSIDDSLIINELEELNSQFKYYLNADGKTYSSSQDFSGAWESYLPMFEMDNIRKQLKNKQDCFELTLYPTDKKAGTVGKVFFSQCGNKNLYYEVSGIEVPLTHLTTDFMSSIKAWFWVYMDGYLKIAAGMVFLALVIIFLTTRSIRKVAKLTSSIEPTKINIQIPEKGLPLEVLPLVRSLNLLLLNLEQNQNQQNFFLSTAAHELRTPLTIVRTRLEEMPDSDIKDQLRNDVRCLVRLSNQLLKLMSISNDKELCDVIELYAMLKKIMIDRAPSAIQKNIDLVLDSSVDEYFVKGDQGLLEVALLNLIDNAISFSSDGDTVTIRLSEDGCIKVTDSGPGINENIKDKLFHPFSKSPPNRDGHGLGLAIVKAIVDLHLGEIIAVNRPGKGAEFDLNLSRIVAGPNISKTIKADPL